jgi:murein DD-endopeptidase MepM/ murein hydrolase activator NlpD
LLNDVQSRLGNLNVAIGQLDSRIASNAVALQEATVVLTTAQANSRALDERVAAIETAMNAARADMRYRAVEAFMHQPENDLINMLLKMSDPAELIDVRGYYRAVVDTQLKAVQAYDQLDKAAKAAAGPADRARIQAAAAQKAVADQQQQLEGLQRALVLIQQESTQQEAEQRTLLGKAGQDKAQFEAELGVLSQQSESIAALLQSLETPGVTAPVPTGGYLQEPIVGAPISQPFGPNRDPFTGAPGFHPGVDFGAKMGTQIRAAGDGTVVFAGWESGYGNFTCINHGHNVATCYGHQSAILVNIGDQVKAGDVIGLVGSTGYSTGPHLHFEVRVNGTPVDPLPWLSAP